MTDGGQDFDLGQVVGDPGATGNGVASVTLISTSGKVKTYRMTFTDGTYVDYQVTDGSDASVTIVTSWNSTTSNSKVPSEKLTKSSLDNKIDKSQTVGLVKNDGSVDTSSYLTTSSASSTYQPLLVSGTNIKTINNNSLLGSGNINIESGSNVDVVTSWESTPSDEKVPSEKLTKNTLDGKAPVSHASSANTYGLGSTSNYGHVKTVNGLTQSSHSDGTALSAYQGKVLKDAIDAKPSASDIPTKISDLQNDSDFIETSSTSGLIKNDGTIDTTSYSTFSGSYNDLSNKPTIPSASTTTPSADTTSGSYGSGTTYARSNHTHPKSSLYAEATHSHTKSQITDFPTIPSKTSDLANDGDGTNAFLTQHQSLTNYVQKSSTTGLLKNDGTVMTSGTGSSNYSAGNHTHSAYVNPTKVTSWSATPSDSNVASEKLIKDSLDAKQATLVSGTNLKTINNNSLLGSGNITIEGGGGGSGGSYINDFYGDSSTNELVIDYDTGVSQADIVTSWSSTPSDTNVPSEKLVKEYIDNQIGTAIQYIQQ